MEVPLFKPVQELLISSNEVPEKYVHNGEGEDISGSHPLIDVPVIDVGLLTDLSEAGKQELEKLRSALNYCGCFQAINHGIESSFLEEVQGVGKEFFALPSEEKRKYVRTADDIEGYGNDSVLSEQQTLDWTDRLYLVVRPEDKRQPKLWPENPERFRAVLHDYTTKLAMLNELILKAMAKSLNLEENCFLNQYGENASMIARYNFYPPCPRPDLALGVKPHADGSAVTFLLQDKEVEGLQILKDGKWFRVPIIPNAILINAGDQVEIMSNGILKSPVHRVVTNSERQRLTLAVFCVPQVDKEVGPAEELINENTPRLYKTVTNYVDLYFQHYQLGRRPIEAARVMV